MLCKAPYIKNGVPLPCGKCLPCRLSRRRTWTQRIILESKCHPTNSFLTLTYSPEALPEDLSINPKVLQRFLKRLRKKIGPRKIKFYACGEYGEEGDRPHYHLVLFNYPPCQYGRPMIRNKKPCPCAHCQTIVECWPFGFSFLGELTLESAQYVAGYCTKKLTDKTENRDTGKHPEFARMSNRPHGIGTGGLKPLIDFLKTDQGIFEIAKMGDVPSVLRHGDKIMPLGHYLRRKIREVILDGPDTPCQRLRELRETNRKKVDDYVQKKRSQGKDVFGSSKDILPEIGKTQIKTIEKKTNQFIRKKR